MVGYSILTSQTASVSVLTIMCHIDLSTSHNYHGPVWQTVCKKSLVIARNFIFINSFHDVLLFPLFSLDVEDRSF